MKFIVKEAGEFKVTDPAVISGDFGEGISIKINGKEYKYTPIENDDLLNSPKYKGDMGKILNTIKFFLKIPAPGKAVQFLKNHFLLFEDISVSPTTDYFKGVIKPFFEETVEGTLDAFLKANTLYTDVQRKKYIDIFLDENPGYTVDDIEKNSDYIWFYFGCDKFNSLEYPEDFKLEPVNEEEDLFDDESVYSYKGYDLVFHKGDFYLRNDKDKITNISFVSDSSEDLESFRRTVDSLIRAEEDEKEKDFLTGYWSTIMKAIRGAGKSLDIDHTQYSVLTNRIYDYFGIAHNAAKDEIERLRASKIISNWVDENNIYDLVKAFKKIYQDTIK